MATQVHRIGLTELYKPRDGSEPNLDIIFVHGLFGHPRNTWTRNTATQDNDEAVEAPQDDVVEHPRIWNRFGSRRRRIQGGITKSYNEVFWPRDLLPAVMPHARIFTWGYDVQIDHIFSSASQASVFQHAETLLLDLTTMRKKPSNKDKPIIFIAHSLGGIVVKDALALSKNEKTFLNEILPATAGVCFLGTPHRGSKVASLGKIAFEISKVFFQNPNLKILRALEVNTEILDRVARSFCHILQERNIQVHSFREELETKGIMIVDSFSSSIGDALETRGMIHANHRDIARYHSAQDNGFERVTDVLLRWNQDLSARKTEKEFESAAKLRAVEVDQRMDYTVREDCLRSLDNSEARLRIANVADVFENTYNWLFGVEDEVGFRHWLSGKTENSMYWIQGKPGSGKSTAMRFAMNHQQTKSLLQEYSHSTWTIAGFFFHDRGSAIQKSIEGLFQEILYQVLHQRQDLIQLVLRVHPIDFMLKEEEKDAALPQSQSTRPKPRTVARISWTSQDAKEALLLIASQEDVDVNMCLFIDALDENSGNHRELLEFFDRLLQCAKSENSHIRLRLCLASRPENIFKKAFASCRRLVIHDRTKEDIRKFALGMMQSEMKTDLPTGTIDQLGKLLEDIINQAQGLFIWVKLVVDELIEGLGEGDTIEELRETLSTIPSELEELYQRTLRRCHRSSIAAHMKSRYEAYVMFQIALYSFNPLPIDEFLQISRSLASADIDRNEVIEQSKTQMQHGLESRSSGLLEIGAVHDRVQFIHQTVKEFMRSCRGTSTLFEKADRVPLETGNLLLLRYYFYRSLQLERNTHVQCLFYHARQHEALTGIASLDVIQKFLGQECESEARWFPILCDLLRQMGPAQLCDAVKSTAEPRVALLVLAVYGGLVTSVRKRLETEPTLGMLHGGLLLVSALYESLREKPEITRSGFPADLELVEAILETGVKADSAFGSLTPLTGLFLHSFKCSVEFRLRPMLEQMRYLIKRGADPNQRVPGGMWTRSQVRRSDDLLLAETFRPESGDTMIPGGRDFSLLFYAIAKNSLVRTRLLLDGGADPGRLNDSGLSALNPTADALVGNEMSFDLNDFKFYCREVGLYHCTQQG